VAFPAIRVAGARARHVAPSGRGGGVFYHYGFWGPATHGVSQVALPHLASYAQYGFLGVPIFLPSADS
jgi:hypothetical protein